MFWRYGFDLLKMDDFVKNMLKNFSNIYTLQEDGQAFETVPQMLRAMGGEEFYGYTQKTTRQTLQKLGIKARLVDELVTAVMRINYGQDVTLNGFAGTSSLAHRCIYYNKVLFCLLCLPNLDYIKKSIAYQGATIWNSLDNGTRVAENLSVFKCNLKMSKVLKGS